jgi:hypothetical protein
LALRYNSNVRWVLAFCLARATRPKDEREGRYVQGKLAQREQAEEDAPDSQ